jgi:4'-phosphopantetheinyl transferase
VWRIDLLSAARLDACRNVLDTRERQIAARFHHRRDAERYVGAHGAMRLILASYTDQPPAGLTYLPGEHGKPRLPGPGAPVFNLSHSGDLALLAVAAQGELGIDVEAATTMTAAEMLDVARGLFSQTEYQCLRELEESQLRRAFLTCWTRKEAYMKAKGLGVVLDPSSFSVTVRCDLTPRLIWSPRFPEDAERYSLVDVDAGRDHAASLAYGDPGGSPVAVFDWRAGAVDGPGWPRP